MTDILKRMTLGALLLLFMPLAVMLSGWQWHLGAMGWGHQLLFWFSQTVTSPWGTLTSALFCIWFLWCLHFRIKSAFFLLVILIGTILTVQYTKNVIKETVQEPRPYVLWLEKTYGVSKTAFYQQQRKQRSEIVHSMLARNNQLPNWLKNYWAFETGFAFPSGHTTFAASWALLGVGLLWPRRCYITSVLLMGWAITVMGSRLVLGMHWPHDLIIATLISWLFTTLATWLVQRFCSPLSGPPLEQQNITSGRNEAD